jgi:hypothetical protein
MSSFTEDLIVRVTNDMVHNRTVFVLWAGFEYRVGDFENPTEIISIPVGFRTDFMSIPAPLRAFIDTGRGAKAAIVHDFMLSHGMPPKKADRIFREALGVLGFSLIERNAFYRAVRLYSQIKQLLGHPVY